MANVFSNQGTIASAVAYIVEFYYKQRERETFVLKQIHGVSLTSFVTLRIHSNIIDLSMFTEHVVDTFPYLVKTNIDYQTMINTTKDYDTHKCIIIRIYS